MDDPPEEPATNALQSPAPTEPPRRYFASLPEKLQERSDVDVTLRAKMDAVRTWSQNLEPFSVPDSDTDGYADSDADADRNADSPGATYSSVSAVATPPAVALVSGDARPDVSGDACSVLRNVLPKRQATVNFVDGRSPSRTVESVRALPVRKICDLHSENAAGNQLPGTKSGSVNDGVCTNPALRSVQTPPSSKQRPVPSVNALISRVYLALNESESSAASSSGSEPPAEFCDSPTEVGVQSPRHGGIPQKPAEPTDGVVTAGNPVSQARTPARTLVKPPTVLTPSFGPSPDGSPKAGGRPPAVPRSLDRKLSDGPWNGTGQPPEGRRTSAEPSPFRRCGSDERTPGGQGTLTGGRRTPGRTRTLSEASSAERHEAAVRLLREQLALLTEGDELRDDVAERAAARWER